MPQMSPLNWLILFGFFLVLYLMFNLLNYFIFLYSTKKSMQYKKQINYNWKW